MTKIQSLRGKKLEPAALLSTVGDYAKSGDKLIVVLISESGHEIFYNDVTISELAVSEKLLSHHIHGKIADALEAA